MVKNNISFGKMYSIVLKILVVFVILSSGSAAASTLTVCPVGCAYSTIQSAITAASTGDTIQVQNGIYYEHVTIAKRIILRGSNTGAKPEVNAGGSGNAIILSANGTVVEGFSATNGDEGIRVISKDNSVKNNTVMNNAVGIHLVSARNNTLTGNTASLNRQQGIYLELSDNNILIKNTANSNTGNTYGSVYGIYLASSNGNNLSGNSANSNTGGSVGSWSGTGGSSYGIYISSSTGNTLNGNYGNSNRGGSAGSGSTGGSSYGIYLTSSTGNTLNGNYGNSNTGGSGGSSGGFAYGIYLTSSTGNILNGNYGNSNTGGSGGSSGGSAYGIYLTSSSSNNLISGATVQSNSNDGVSFFSSNGNTLSASKIISNGGYGTYLSSSSSNTLNENNLSSNGNYNIYLSTSTMNLIFHNNLNGTSNAFDNSINSWDNGAEGNYYSDYTGEDINGDGIGDSPYSISGGSSADNYPLMKPFKPKDVTPPGSIINLKPASISATYIKWTWTDPADPDFAKVMIYINGVFKKNVTKGTKYYNATNLTPNTQYIISTHTVDASGNINYAWVNNTSKTYPLKPVIVLSSPNGGEKWQAGTKHAIKWTYIGSPGSYIKIDLLKSGILNRTINSSTSIVSGSYNWTIPSNQTPGTDYRVRITSITNPAYNDSSNANFNISAPLPICKNSTIWGYSFNDTNINKTKDAGEAGLSNWTINLKGQDTCTRTLVSRTIKTNSTGYFAFKNVNPGSYLLSEDYVLDWMPTTDAGYTITVPSNSTTIRRDFGNRKII